jgi:undecaprenyl-diphosphatase
MDFIFILKAVIIAIVEGITEFIPISSTGHMILVGDLINFNNTEFTKMFEVVIQLGAILAIIVLYWSKFWENIKQLFSGSKKAIHFWSILVVGVIPFGILGVLLDKKIKANLFTTKTVMVGFILGGILLIIFENHYNKRKELPEIKSIKDISDITFKQTMCVGIFQCLALWPGMSRSASTIIGGWIAGIPTSIVAEFSFFLAVPVMFGASALDLIKFDYSKITTSEVVALIVGFIIAFIVSLLVVEKFVTYLKKKPMKAFSIYRIAVGVILSVLVFANIIK